MSSHEVEKDSGAHHFSGPHAFNFPRQSDWECELFGAGRSLTFRPRAGCEPNWFWRWTQWVCFGNRWVRVKGDTKARPKPCAPSDELEQAIEEAEEKLEKRARQAMRGALAAGT